MAIYSDEEKDYNIVDWANASLSKENSDKLYKALHEIRIESQQNLKLVIDNESVNIYREEEGIDEPIHIVYWHLDEVEEDASVAISIANAIQLYYTNQEELLKTLGLESYII